MAKNITNWMKSNIGTIITIITLFFGLTLKYGNLPEQVDELGKSNINMIEKINNIDHKLTSYIAKQEEVCKKVDEIYGDIKYFYRLNMGHSNRPDTNILVSFKQ